MRYLRDITANIDKRRSATPGTPEYFALKVFSEDGKMKNTREYVHHFHEANAEYNIKSDFTKIEKVKKDGRKELLGRVKREL